MCLKVLCLTVTSVCSYNYIHLCWPSCAWYTRFSLY